jgi:hypothetical protein
MDENKATPTIDSNINPNADVVLSDQQTISDPNAGVEPSNNTTYKEKIGKMLSAVPRKFLETGTKVGYKVKEYVKKHFLQSDPWMKLNQQQYKETLHHIKPGGKRTLRIKKKPSSRRRRPSKKRRYISHKKTHKRMR